MLSEAQLEPNKPLRCRVGKGEIKNCSGNDKNLHQSYHREKNSPKLDSDALFCHRTKYRFRQILSILSLCSGECQ